MGGLLSIFSTTEPLTKPLVILDLNEFLVHRAFRPKMEEEYPHMIPYIPTATVLGEHYTWKRPYLNDFIRSSAGQLQFGSVVQCVEEECQSPVRFYLW